METIKSKILITGATGNVGLELAKQLSAQGISFRAMVRSLDQATSLSSLKGAELVVADFNQPESIAIALDGIEKAFLLTSSSALAEQQQKDFVDAAKTAGVQHIVKLSQLHASKTSPVRFLRYHAAVEEEIKSSGIAYTFLRPNLFMQGFLGFRELIINQHQFFASIGDAKISIVDIRDIAAVAACALTQTGHEQKTYDITGPESLTHAELAACFSEVLAKAVHFVSIPADSMKNALVEVGFPEWQADGLIEDYDHYGRNEAAEVSSAVQEVTNQAPGTFLDFVKHYKSMFE